MHIYYTTNKNGKKNKKNKNKKNKKVYINSGGNFWPTKSKIHFRH